MTAEASEGLSRNGPLDSPAPEEELQVSAEDEAALMAELTEFRRRQSSGQSLSSLQSVIPSSPSRLSCGHDMLYGVLSLLHHMAYCLSSTTVSPLTTASPLPLPLLYD